MAGTGTTGTIWIFHVELMDWDTRSKTALQEEIKFSVP